MRRCTHAPWPIYIRPEGRLGLCLLGGDKLCALLELKEGLECSRDRLLLAAGRRPHWLPRKTTRRSLQGKGVLHAGRQIVANDCVPKPQ